MLIEAIQHDVTITSASPVIRATIRATAKNFKSLTGDIYSNVIEAVVREYVSNAVDAHTSAGCPEVATHVYLPNSFVSDFRVTDHGIGMSREFMETKFLAIGDGSTKDQDNNCIGGKGLGCKVGFAYADQWNITTTFDGERCAFAMFLDDEGIPAMQLLDASPTSAPNGTTITIPVKAEDIAKFQNAAKKILPYFPTPPVVIGYKDGEIPPPNYLARGDGWALRQQVGTQNIIMGGVRYPADIGYPQYYQMSDTARAMLNLGLDLYLPIGAVEPSASREALRFTDENAKMIGAILDASREAIALAFTGIYEHHETLWDAVAALSQDLSATDSARKPLISDVATWKGQKLETFIKAPYLDSWHLPKPGRGVVGTSLNTQRFTLGGGTIRPNDIEKIIIHTAEDGKWVHKRFLEGQNLYRDKATWVFRDIRNVQALLDKLGNPPEHVLEFYADYPVPYKAPRVIRPRVKKANPLQGLEGFVFSGECPADGSRADSGRYHVIDLATLPKGGFCYHRLDLGKITSIGLPYSMQGCLNFRLIPRERVVFVPKVIADRLEKLKIPTFEQVWNAAYADTIKTRGKELALRKFLSSVSHTSIVALARHPDLQKPRGELATIRALYAKHGDFLQDPLLNLAGLPELPAPPFNHRPSRDTTLGYFLADATFVNKFDIQIANLILRQKGAF